MRHALDTLPHDVLITLTGLLDAPELIALAQTCSTIRAICLEHGFSTLERRLRPCPITLRRAWPIQKRAVFAWQIERARSATDCIVSTLATWPGKVLPVVSLDERRVLIAAGTSLRAISFDDHALPIRSPPPRPTVSRKAGVEDVAAIALWQDQAIIGRVSGAIEALRVANRETVELARYGRSKAPVQALATIDDLLISAHAVEHRGSLSLRQLRSPWAETIDLPLPSKPWSLHASSGNRWLAVGAAKLDPLSVYTPNESGIDVSQPRKLVREGQSGQTAVYGLSTAMPGSVLSPDCLVSGWYDGAVRIYDLREAANTPRITLSTRWSEDAVFSVASAGFQVVAGMARHSALRIADLRMSSGAQRDVGLTLYATAREASPIYSLAMEGSRIFGATASGAFMVEYGPDVVAQAFGVGGDRRSGEDPWRDLRPRYILGSDDVQLRRSRPATDAAPLPATHSSVRRRH